MKLRLQRAILGVLVTFIAATLLCASVGGSTASAAPTEAASLTDETKDR